MSPKEITKVDITNEVFKEPIEVVKQLSSNLNLKYELAWYSLVDKSYFSRCAGGTAEILLLIVMGSGMAPYFRME